jgi:hypothetical protein
MTRAATMLCFTCGAVSGNAVSAGGHKGSLQRQTNHALPKKKTMAGKTPVRRPVAKSAWMLGASQRRLEAARVIAVMAKGATLDIVFTENGSHWLLSNGKRVDSAVALAVINDVRIVEGTSQTWHYTQEE